MAATATVTVKLADTDEVKAAVKRAYRAGVRDSAALIGNVNTIERVPGAELGLPQFNPLWDAARLIERELLP